MHLKFYASVRLDIRRIGQVKEGDEIVGSETKVKVVKTKWRLHLKKHCSKSCMVKV
jgi:recombination protein RecA